MTAPVIVDEAAPSEAAAPFEGGTDVKPAEETKHKKVEFVGKLPEADGYNRRIEQIQANGVKQIEDLIAHRDAEIKAWEEERAKERAAILTKWDEKIAKIEKVTKEQVARWEGIRDAAKKEDEEAAAREAEAIKDAEAEKSEKVSF